MIKTSSRDEHITTLSRYHYNDGATSNQHLNNVIYIGKI